MPTIHEDIEPWLAAAVHDELSPKEAAQFQEHLASCDRCRALHAEELTMSKMITSTLQPAKPDFGFEQRIVSGFRRGAPVRAGLRELLGRLVQHRAIRIAAAALLLVMT